MEVTPLIPAGRTFIEAYGDGRFRIAGSYHDHPVLVLPDRTLAWPVASFADAGSTSFEPLHGFGVEILLIGCGPRIAMLPRVLREELRSQGIVADVMDTGAACRTYNVLLSEERRVAAALIPVD